jgi:predicted glutamine amidotransferase
MKELLYGIAFVSGFGYAIYLALEPIWEDNDNKNKKIKKQK